MLQPLLKKLQNNKISLSELHTLKEKINNTSDSELLGVLSGLWEDFDANGYFTPKEISSKLDELNISSTRKVTFDFTKLLRIAAIIMLPLLTLLSGYLYMSNSKLKVYSNNNVVIDVAKGQRANITLPDGSKVLLNSGSTLSYQANFGVDNRNIEFTGEAYFEVAKDPNKRFVVHTKTINVEVFGTTFNLLAHNADKTVELTLIEGKVKARTQLLNPEQAVFVSPNQKLIFEKQSGLLKIKETTTKDEIAWTKGILLFKSQTLNDVLEKIERNFNVQIHISKSDSLLFQDTFTGRFDSLDFKGVMDIIKKHYRFSYVEKGKNIYISTN